MAQLRHCREWWWVLLSPGSVRQTVWWLPAVRVIPSTAFNFEMILPVMTSSCDPSAYRAVPAPPSSKFSAQAALSIDPSVTCPVDVKRKRPGVEMGKHKSCTAAVWGKLR